MASEADDRLFRATQFKVYLDLNTRTLTVNGVTMVSEGKFLPAFKEYLANKTVELERVSKEADERQGRAWAGKSLDQMRQSSIYWLPMHMDYAKRFLEYLTAVAAKS